MPEAENQKQKQDQNPNPNQGPVPRRRPKDGGPRRIKPSAPQASPQRRPKKKSMLRKIAVPAVSIAGSGGILSFILNF